ncbi:MAG: UDP-3-O-(3-hydroxymyristoyl)glucosamine N-acyltransferase, partial [Phycisphaerae bacterium]|nr:UDP-3-O-(3-hydroxymyristoyl)glucosamine N-acyltransferase [Phycisphaerae bacterium]
MTHTLSEIARLLGTTVRGDGTRAITGMATLTDADEHQLSFLGTDAFVKQFRKTRAAGVIVQKKVKLPAETSHGPAVLFVENADLAVATVLTHFAPATARPPVGIDKSAIVAASAVLGKNVSIGPNVSVGERTRIDAGCTIHPNVVIGDDVTIGENTTIYSNVTVRERITIGARVIINAGSVLGTDGFGYRWDGTKHVKIPQIGTVVIEDDVELG